MSILTSFAGLDWAEKIGITLIHSFWQIALVAIVYALAKFLLQLRSAHMRYITGCCALSAMLVAPVSTYFVLSNAQPDVASPEVANLTGGSSQDTRGSESEAIPNPAGEASAATIPTESKPSAAPDTKMVEANASITDPAQITPVANTSEEPPAVDLTEALRSCLPWATGVWIIGVIVLTLRPLCGWLHILRLRRHGLSALPDALQNAGQRTMRRLGVLRAVRLVQSAIVEVPTVIGFLRPIVLLPASVVSGLSTEEIELILAHELAHVRRNDWIVNLAQTVVEALLFYHPAMWWVSGQIRAERENCCDDMAVATEGRRAAYARTLAHLEELRQTAPIAVLNATGGSLIARVRRLAGKPVGNCGRRRFDVCLAGPPVLAIAAMTIAVAMATGGTEGKPTSDGAQQQGTSYPADADNETDARTGSKSSREATFKLTVRDAQGNPVPHAKVNHSRVDRDKKRAYLSRTADEWGVVVLATTKPENIGWFSFSVKTAGYAPFFGQWDNWDSNDTPPNEFTVRLKKGKTIGGVVQNEQGEAVEGVKVSFSFPYGADGMRRDDGTHCSAGGATDADGRWTCGYVPLKLTGTKRFTLNHPDYKTCQFDIALRGLLADDNGEFAKVMVITKGNAISGTVQDASGRPLADADVFIEFVDVYGTEKDCMRQTKTDQEGEYRFEDCPLGPVVIAARSPGNAIQTQSHEISNRSEPVDITMKPDEPLSLRVVNREGRPMEGVYFYVRTWQGSRWIRRKLLSRDNDRTDVDGRFTWTDAPQEEMGIEVYAEDHMQSEALSVRAGEDEHVFELHPSLDIFGAVTDKLSGKPIPKFTVTPGIFYHNMPERICWQPEKARDHQGGQYATRQKKPYAGYAIRIEAEGYIPQESRKIEISEGAVTLDFAMEKVNEEYLKAQNELNRSGPRGVVLTPDGKPAAGATLGFTIYGKPAPGAMLPPGFANVLMGSYIKNGVLLEEPYRFFMYADGQGKFTIPPLKPKEDYPSAYSEKLAVTNKPRYAIVVLHDSGFAYLDYDEIKRRTEKDATAFDSPIQLQKWARVEGRLMLGDKPAVECPVNLQVEGPISTEAPNAARRPSGIWYDYKTTTDRQGRFVFDSVPPGMTGTVAGTISFARDGGSKSQVSSHAVPVVFNPGKTTEVLIGGKGRPVAGQLRYVDGFPNQVDWKFALVRIKPAVWSDVEGYPLCSAVNSKGRFRVEDVPKGDWVLSVEITNPRSRTDRSAPSRLVRQEYLMTVPEAPDGRPNELLDIGVLTLSQSTD